MEYKKSDKPIYADPLKQINQVEQAETPSVQSRSSVLKNILVGIAGLGMTIAGCYYLCRPCISPASFHGTIEGMDVAFYECKKEGDACTEYTNKMVVTAGGKKITLIDKGHGAGSLETRKDLPPDNGLDWVVLEEAGVEKWYQNPVGSPVTLSDREAEAVFDKGNQLYARLYQIIEKETKDKVSRAFSVQEGAPAK